MVRDIDQNSFFQNTSTRRDRWIIVAVGCVSLAVAVLLVVLGALGLVELEEIDVSWKTFM